MQTALNVIHGKGAVEYSAGQLIQMYTHGNIDSFEENELFSSGSIFLDSVLDKMYSHFCYLHRDRPCNGYSIQKIPVTNILNYAKLSDIEDLEYFKFIITGLDDLYVKETNEYLETTKKPGNT